MCFLVWIQASIFIATLLALSPFARDIWEGRGHEMSNLTKSETLFLFGHGFWPPQNDRILAL